MEPWNAPQPPRRALTPGLDLDGGRSLGVVLDRHDRRCVSVAAAALSDFAVMALQHNAVKTGWVKTAPVKREKSW